MADDILLVERQGPIAILTLNDPGSRNALTPRMVKAITAFVGGANADQTLGCIVLTGGDGFCSGGNIKDMVAKSDPMFAGSAFDMKEGYRNGIQMIPRLFQTLDVPVIAAVSGAAIGAGCDLACMCDIRLASPDAKFAESFLRVGIVPGDGGAWLLPRVVGYPRAIEMALTCRMIGAEEAKEWGLVTHIVAKDRLLEEALGIARKITAFPPLSIRLNKRLMKLAQQMSLNETLEISAAYQAIIQNTKDQREAVTALVEKRDPKFVGE